MIEKDQLIEIGRIGRLHGLYGELTVALSDTVFDRVERCPYLVVQIDGLYVPCFIGSYRLRSENSMLLRLDGFDTQAAAQELVGHTLWFHRRCFTPAEAEAYDAAAGAAGRTAGLTGFAVVDATHGLLGTVDHVDDQTANILLVVSRPDGSELLVPAADDLITSLDPDGRTIYMDLPPGLVDMDEAETEE